MKHVGFSTTLCLTVLLIVAALPSSGEADAHAFMDPAQWYANSYGPLWHDQSWEKVDEILAHYDTEIWDHPAAGQAERKQTAQWLAEAMQEWRAEGWVSSEVPDIRVNHINASTASFTTRWLDHYENREDEYSCAWYLADRIDGSWKFTHFAPIDWDAHGF